MGRTLKVLSGQRRIGLLRVFENVSAVNSEEAQWSTQAQIDLNLGALRRIEEGSGWGRFLELQPFEPCI